MDRIRDLSQSVTAERIRGEWIGFSKYSTQLSVSADILMKLRWALNSGSVWCKFGGKTKNLGDF